MLGEHKHAEYVFADETPGVIINVPHRDINAVNAEQVKQRNQASIPLIQERVIRGPLKFGTTKGRTKPFAN